MVPVFSTPTPGVGRVSGSEKIKYHQKTNSANWGFDFFRIWTRGQCLRRRGKCWQHFGMGYADALSQPPAGAGIRAVGTDPDSEK
jgi:hypothetical protein